MISIDLVRRLARQNLEGLGVSDTGPFIEQEMVRNFSTLANAVPAGDKREERLREVISRAIEEAIN